jgi:hypothetical protein
VFRARIGQDTVAGGRDRPGQTFSFSAEAEIAAMPGFQRPGRFSRWFDNGNFTSFDARIAWGDAGSELDLDIDSHLAGDYSQDIQTSDGGLVGHANEIAIATGLRYVDRRSSGVRDQYGIVHFPHPVERAWIHLGPARLELGADVSGDFASLYSAAYEDFQARFGSDGVKASLLRHGYTHGLGFSGGVSAAVVAGALELGARARHGRYSSIDGLERNQDEVTRDSHSTETITDYGAHLRIEPPDTVLSARFELAEMRRGSTLESSLGTFRKDRAQRRMSVELGIRF